MDALPRLARRVGLAPDAPDAEAEEGLLLRVDAMCALVCLECGCANDRLSYTTRSARTCAGFAGAAMADGPDDCGPGRVSLVVGGRRALREPPVVH